MPVLNFYVISMNKTSSSQRYSQRTLDKNRKCFLLAHGSLNEDNGSRGLTRSIYPKCTSKRRKTTKKLI